MTTTAVSQTWTKPPWIVFKPEVKILAETYVNDEDLLIDINSPDCPSYVDALNDAEALIEFAGRQCYESFHNPRGRTNEGYIKNIINLKHYSVLEHANVTFLFEGISRSVSHELVRHRHFSYSQLSQRYVDSTQSRFVCPPLIQADYEAYLSWLDSVVEIRERLSRFQELMERRSPNLPRKKIREAVRSIAPNCIETKIVVTGNVRSWREMLEKRWHLGADAEIYAAAKQVALQLKKRYPSVFADIEEGG